MNGDDEALAIMQEWSWEHWAFGESLPMTRKLSDVVNELAFCGHDDAAGAMLTLLASDRVYATGSYKWRAFRSEHYENAGDDRIPAARWQALQKGLAMPRDSDGRCVHITLEVIPGLSEKPVEVSVAEWGWRNNRFATASKSHDKYSFQSEYSEESFAVYNIEIIHKPAEVVSLEALAAPAKEVRNKGGRPAIYEWEKAIAALVFRWADNGDWQPASKAAVQRALGDWFAEQGVTPSDSSLKQHARWLFPEFESRKLEGQ